MSDDIRAQLLAKAEFHLAQHNRYHSALMALDELLEDPPSTPPSAPEPKQPRARKIRKAPTRRVERRAVLAMELATMPDAISVEQLASRLSNGSRTQAKLWLKSIYNHLHKKLIVLNSDGRVPPQSMTAQTEIPL